MLRLRGLIIAFVILAVLFLIIGIILVQFGLFEKTSYINIAAIVGGTASVLGLLAFLIPTVAKNDIEQVGVEYLKNVVEAAEELELKEGELKEKEKQLTSKERQLKELEIKKQEMEVLIRKASLRLFLQDQITQNQKRITNIISKNDELKVLLEERIPLIQKTQALQVEIESDPNVETLEDVMIAINPNYKRSVDHGLEVKSSSAFFSSFLGAFMKEVLRL